jgi:EmrB/QacA subfamily drug resistance transporter
MATLNLRERLILTATVLGSSMAFIDGTAVNTALPIMQRDLEASVGTMQWVVEAYLLMLSALILVGGALGDRFGRRKVFMIGVATFALASAWCGLAPDSGQLILARAVQGAAGALLVPGSLAILRSAMAEDRRGKAIGMWSGLTSLMTAVGQVAGGWLAESVSWRWIFWINVPMAVVTLLLTWRMVPESGDPDAPTTLDWPGALLVVFGLGSLVYGLIAASSRTFADPTVLGAIAAGVAGLAGFLWREATTQAPMMPLDLFRNRTFAGTNLLTLLLYAALGAAFFFLPFDLIQIHRYTATAAGAAMLPSIVIMFLLSGWAGGLADRYGARRPLIIGPVVAGLGFALMALPGVGGSYWTTFFPAVSVFGLGMTITVAPLTTAVMNAASEAQAGLASGINNAVARVAGLVAIASLGAALVVGFGSGLEQRLTDKAFTPAEVRTLVTQRDRLAEAKPPAEWTEEKREAAEQAVDGAFVDGFRVVMVLCAALAFAGAAAAALLVEERSGTA